VGRRADNVGIVAFNARRYPANPLAFEIFLEVVNYGQAGGKPKEVDLQLLTDGMISEVQRLSLRPGQRARYSCGNTDGSEHRRWCELAASGDLLEVRLVAAGAKGGKADRELDAFALDDRAYALLPRRRKTRVLLVSKGNLFLEGALLLAENLELQRVTPESYTPAAAARVDAVVFDGVAPDDAAGKHLLLVNPPADAGSNPVKIRRQLANPAITDQRSDHPAMRWITLKDVNISVSSVFEPTDADTVLAASFRQPLIIAREQKRRRIIAIGFDPRRSDLPLRVAFPLLMINAFHWFAGEDDSLLMTYRTGKLWRVPLRDLGLATAAEFLTVVAPDGQRLRAPVQSGQLLLFGRHAGLYEVQSGSESVRLAANLFDPVESKIAPVQTLSIAGQKIARPSGFGVGLRREIWIYFVLIAGALLLLEWLTYNRRVTV